MASAQGVPSSTMKPGAAGRWPTPALGSATVAAVVVTYNRTDELMKCLGAIDRQTRPVDRVILIDNGASERTRRDLEVSRLAVVSRLIHLAPASNAGGAGGFCVGMERAYRAGFTWLWLMDDDVIPEPTALHELLDAYERAPASSKPVLLASRVVWLDGRPLAANMPKPKRSSRGAAFAADVESIRVCTFVSAIVHRTAVAKHGYPIPDYFTLVDDTEYTQRILRHDFGVLARRSVAWHNTTPQRVYSRKPARFYFLARNYLWMLLHSEALSRLEKLVRVPLYIGAVSKYVLTRRLAPDAVTWALRGVLDGLLTK
ncbi:MAG: glycosyltransferase, partial [Candidatus Eremiobacteraeota bacterium]|nr:glycosyltransferase [Candidatus Eremiobacteraeota bacterium]